MIKKVKNLTTTYLSFLISGREYHAGEVAKLVAKCKAQNNEHNPGVHSDRDSTNDSRDEVDCRGGLQLHHGDVSPTGEDGLEI